MPHIMGLVSKIFTELNTIDRTRTAKVGYNNNGYVSFIARKG